MSLFPTQAIVLAAGLGTRLRPLTNEIPKPLLPVGGVPILLFNLYLLKQAGIKNITLNLHHQPQKVMRLLGAGKSLGLNLHYSLEPKILGTAGGIAQALHQMKPITTFVVNGDILCDVDLRKMYQRHQEARALATLACVPKDRAKVESFVEFSESGKIFRIAHQPPSQFSWPKLQKGIFSGIHLIEPKVLQNYPTHYPGCIIREVYQPLLAQGGCLQTYFHSGAWWDLGSIEELKSVDQGLWRETLSENILRQWKEIRTWSKSLFYRS